MYSPKASLTCPDDFNFPFQPYEIQKQLMTELYKVLERKEIGIFESPTGTGKSLTLTCAALKWLEDHEALVRKELYERLQQVVQEIQKLEEEKNLASDWISMHSQTSQQKQELMELKEIQKLLETYEEQLKVIRDKGKVRNQNRTKQHKPKRAQLEPKDRLEILGGENVELDDEIKCDDDDEDEEKDLPQTTNKYRNVQIFFCSRTHTQLAQVVGEIKRTAYGQRVRCVSMASRQQLCIHKELRKLNNTAMINEKCLDMAKSTNAKTTASDANGSIKKKSRVSDKSLGKCQHKVQSLVQELSDLSLAEILDIEDLVSEGEQLESCPYYAARTATQMAQIIMLPYQMLLHKRTREQAGIDIKDSVIIIDEAHNLLDSISDIYSCDLSLIQLQSAQQQIVAYKMKYSSRFSSSNLLSINKLIFVIKRLIKLLTVNDNTTATDASTTSLMFCTYELMSEGDFFNIDLYQLLQFCEKTRFAQKLQGFSKGIMFDPKTNENPAPKVSGKAAALGLLQRLQQNHEDKLKKTKTKKLETLPDSKTLLYEDVKKPPVVLNAIRSLLTFIEALCEKAEDGRIILNRGEVQTGSKYETQPGYKYILLNPGAHFQDIIKEARAIIVAGGTMQPTTELTEQLFNLCPERVKQHFYDHVVPDDAVLPYVVTKGPSGRSLCFNFTQRASTTMLTDLCSVLENLCNVIPAGIVCFVPSYDYLDSVYEQLQKSGVLERISNKKRIFREPRSDSSNPNELSVEQILNDYGRIIKRQQGALLLSVVGAKLSEGLNFADDLGRGVIVVGMPYPYVNSPEIQERMSYLDKTLGPGSGAEYYENLCMKAVNQCIGRSVRHIRDYACVYLLDERYARESTRKKLPQWISRHLQIAPTYGKVQAGTAKFFKQKKLQQAQENQ